MIRALVFMLLSDSSDGGDSDSSDGDSSDSDSGDGDSSDGDSGGSDGDSVCDDCTSIGVVNSSSNSNLWSPL